MSKIVRLQSENIKRVVAVDITPQGNTVIISGKNEQGKTSVLDSIAWAFEGARAVDDVPIRAGAEEGHIRVELEDLVIEKKITAKGQTLKVSNKEGARFASPQEMLDKFLGAIAFDPLQFIKLKSADQYHELSKLIKIEYDIAAHETAQKTDFEKRTEVNRRRDALAVEGKALVDKLPKEGEVVPERVDILALVAKGNDFRDKKAKADDFVRRSTTLATHGNNIRSQLDAAKREVERLENALTEAVQQAEAITSEMDEFQKTMPTPEEVDALAKELETAEETNNKVSAIERTRVEYDAKKSAWKTADDEAKALTAKLKERDDAKAKAIAAVKMPIDGLELKEGKVFYKDFPLSQASGAAQLRVSMAIAMAANPKLRVIRVKDASLLDESNMALIKEMADANDFQIWLEVVQSADPMAVIIEDGKVKGAKEPESIASKKKTDKEEKTDDDKKQA